MGPEIFDESVSVIYNPLSKHMYGKLAFIVWQKYSENLLEKVLKCEFEGSAYFEEDSSGEEMNDIKEEEYLLISESRINAQYDFKKKHFVSGNNTPPSFQK